MKSVETVLQLQISKSSEDIVQSFKNKNEQESNEIDFTKITELIQMD